MHIWLGLTPQAPTLCSHTSRSGCSPSQNPRWNNTWCSGPGQTYSTSALGTSSCCYWWPSPGWWALWSAAISNFSWLTLGSPFSLPACSSHFKELSWWSTLLQAILQVLDTKGDCPLADPSSWPSNPDLLTQEPYLTPFNSHSSKKRSSKGPQFPGRDLWEDLKVGEGQRGEDRG